MFSVAGAVSQPLSVRSAAPPDRGATCTASQHQRAKRAAEAAARSWLGSPAQLSRSACMATRGRLVRVCLPFVWETEPLRRHRLSGRRHAPAAARPLDPAGPQGKLRAGAVGASTGAVIPLVHSAFSMYPSTLTPAGTRRPRHQTRLVAPVPTRTPLNFPPPLSSVANPMVPPSFWGRRLRRRSAAGHL
eukprot:tig00000076_g2319.t1